MQPGRFICLEGIEGSGKTTQLDFIQRYLQSFNISVITTREPGGTPLAESIRQIFLETETSQESILPETELLLLFAARRQHIMQVIQPALKKGIWVICDRFTEASYAYQGGGRGVSLDFIQLLESYTHQDLSIDRVILLDIPVSTALERLHQQYHNNNQAFDRMEKESMAFFERVQKSYLQRAGIWPTRYRVIHAAAPLVQVQSQITTILDELLLESKQSNVSSYE